MMKDIQRQISGSVAIRTVYALGYRCLEASVWRSTYRQNHCTCKKTEQMKKVVLYTGEDASKAKRIAHVRKQKAKECPGTCKWPNRKPL